MGRAILVINGAAQGGPTKEEAKMSVYFYQIAAGKWQVLRGSSEIGLISENPDGSFDVRVNGGRDSRVTNSLSDIQLDIIERA